jgi:hypothetical protein
MTTILLITLLGAAPVQLQARAVPGTRPVPPQLIVGRSGCGGATWLLTDARDLVQIPHETNAPVIRAVKGLQAGDKPWGLACLIDGSLWTLANSFTLVRMTPDGIVRERVTLRVVMLSLFGWTDRLLFVQLPLLIARPILTTALPRSIGEQQPWPKFLGRAAESRADLIARNLVNCGIGRGRDLPCWFADDRRITVSDGLAATSVSFAALYDGPVDAAAPIWDVALGGATTRWVLVTAAAPVAGHKVGGRLAKTTAQGETEASLSLTPPARAIVHAGDTRCVLLTVDGQLVEVVQR